MNIKLLFFLLFSSVAFSQLTLTTPSPLEVCDINNDGFSVFNLTLKDSEITASLPVGSYAVGYFETSTDAQTGANPIASPINYYNFVASMQTLYVKVTDLNNVSSFGFTTLTIRVWPSPYAYPVGDIFVCDGPENDGFATFDLSLMDLQITGGVPSLTVDYFETLTDAQDGVNAVPDIYTNITPGIQTIFARATNPYGCYAITTFDLRVEPVPFAVQPPDLTIYQSPYIGNAAFSLWGQRELIVNGQANVSVAFYLSAADAQSGVAVLPSCFTNVSSPQTIWARATNNYTGCYSLTNFNLIVSPDSNPNPTVSIPDANFKAKLLQTAVGSNSCGQWLMIDSNGDGEIQTDEAFRVGRLFVNNSAISSLEGIQSFTNLEVLSCAGNQLTELDLSGLNLLGSLNCSQNQLATLDLSETHVQTLSCSNNVLTYINLKNGVDYYIPAEFPGFWNNNPLQYVCADSFDLQAIDDTLSLSMITGVAVVTDCSLGINEQTANGGISIYPNPADDIVNIQSASVLRSVGVFDIGGRKIFSQTIGGDDARIDLSRFQSGIYILRITAADGEKILKIIKK